MANRAGALLSLLTRQVFQVHNFFIALLVSMIGVCSLFYTNALLGSGSLSRIVLAGLVFVLALSIALPVLCL